MSLAEGDCSPGRCPSVLGKKPAQHPVGAPVRHLVMRLPVPTCSSSLPAPVVQALNQALPPSCLANRQ